MENLKQINIEDIDPKDFRNWIVFVAPIESPNREFLARVQDPKIIVGEGRRAITRLVEAPGLMHPHGIKWPLIIPFEVFVKGGEFRGLKYPGILEEVALIYGS